MKKVELCCEVIVQRLGDVQQTVHYAVSEIVLLCVWTKGMLRPSSFVFKHSVCIGIQNVFIAI